MTDLAVAINAVVAFLSVCRLLSYQRNGARYKWHGSLFAFVVATAYGSILIRILTGDYTCADIAEAVVNTAFCVALFASKGNVMTLLKVFRDERFIFKGKL